jgi:ubiquinone/menaquinone biosynthesis C-methylase UbiE
MGDMHKMNLEPKSYDAIIYGWVLAYSTDPQAAIVEGKKFIKPGGYLAVGMETVAEEQFKTLKDKRANQVLNTLTDLKKLVNEELVFGFDPGGEETREIAGIFRLK